MKYRNQLINPVAPVESPSFSEWSEDRDGWEGRLPKMVKVTEAVDKCVAIREAVEWMKNMPNSNTATPDDPVVGRYTTAMMHYFRYGYQERREKHLTEFKEMMECKPNILALNPKAGKRGPGNTWVRGTGTTISAIKKLKPVSIKKETSTWMSFLFDFTYTSSATIQSWSDSSSDGIKSANRFSMMSKNNENRRLGMMITAEIPPDQMLFSTTFTDTIKQRLAMNQEVESVRIGNTPLKVKAKVWFDADNMGARYYTVPYIESILNEVSNKDAEILLGWLDKVMGR